MIPEPDFGPWLPGLEPADYLARVRALRVCVLAFARPNIELLKALYLAETDPTQLGTAVAMFDGLAAKPRRQILTLYAEATSPRWKERPDQIRKWFKLPKPKPEQKEPEMKMKDVFPSKYWKAEDIKERGELVATIAYVKQEMVGADQDLRAVVYFSGHDKGLILNKTNWTEIANILGDESDSWTGKSVVLFPTRTQFGSRMVDAIRVRVPQEHVPASKKKSQEPKQTAAEELNDSIPF